MGKEKELKRLHIIISVIQMLLSMMAIIHICHALCIVEREAIFN